MPFNGTPIAVASSSKFENRSLEQMNHQRHPRDRPTEQKRASKRSLPMTSLGHIPHSQDAHKMSVYRGLTSKLQTFQAFGSDTKSKVAEEETVVRREAKVPSKQRIGGTYVFAWASAAFMICFPSPCPLRCFATTTGKQKWTLVSFKRRFCSTFKVERTYLFQLEHQKGHH